MLYKTADVEIEAWRIRIDWVSIDRDIEMAKAACVVVFFARVLQHSDLSEIQLFVNLERLHMKFHIIIDSK
jgi:hypothetical protein